MYQLRGTDVFDKRLRRLRDKRAKARIVARLGAVLSADDRFIHLLESPMGSAFARDPGSGEFQLLPSGS